MQQQGLRSRKTIALIGMRGAGKTTIGRLLAERLGGTFVDTDEIVTINAGKSISEIIQSEGENGFRDLEHDALRAAIALSPDVISVGGGGILRPENRVLLRQNCFVVWLTADIDILSKRINNDEDSRNSRPPLTSLDQKEELRVLQASRNPLYSEITNLTLETSQRAPAELVAKLLGEYPAER